MYCMCKQFCPFPSVSILSISIWTRLLGNSVDDLDIDLEAHEGDTGVIVLFDQLLVLGHLLQVLLSLDIYTQAVANVQW